jgi:ubiquinone/menaquinone biosynthesis C-methylase UbiE
MSVSSHLAIDLEEYDERIRTFIPSYEEMLDVAAHVVALARPATVVDLGTGTGALAMRVARAVPSVTIVGIDEDAGMLGMAARRLRRKRFTSIHESFLTATLPRCDAFSASLALHHIERPRTKRALFARAHAALRPGGVVVSADCHPPAADWLAQDGRRAWLAHLASSYGRKQGERYLDTWAKEDFYTTLESEQRLLHSAGFTTKVVWRRGLFAVIAATKDGR